MLDTQANYANYVMSADESAVSRDVQSIISQIAAVDYCAILVWKNRLLVGVIPGPLFSRSERTRLEEQIAQAVSQEYGFEEILISFDMDILYEIAKLNKTSVDDKVIETLFYSVKVRRSI